MRARQAHNIFPHQLAGEWPIDSGLGTTAIGMVAPTCRTHMRVMFNPDRYEVHLEARIDANNVSVEGSSCHWTIGSPAGTIDLGETGPTAITRLPLGTFSVRVEVELPDGRTAEAHEKICVKDILIVALGDSLATGEGNPEEPRTGIEPAIPSRAPCCSAARPVDTGRVG